MTSIDLGFGEPCVVKTGCPLAMLFIIFQARSTKLRHRLFPMLVAGESLTHLPALLLVVVDHA